MNSIQKRNLPQHPAIHYNMCTKNKHGGSAYVSIIVWRDDRDKVNDELIQLFYDEGWDVTAIQHGDTKSLVFFENVNPSQKILDQCLAR